MNSARFEAVIREWAGNSDYKDLIEMVVEAQMDKLNAGAISQAELANWEEIADDLDIAPELK